MSKAVSVRRILRSYGFVGLAYELSTLLPLRIGRTGQRWLSRTLLRRHNPYSADLAVSRRCPHCRSSLESMEDELYCPRCEDYYI
jgi:uncharacterized paraquat-inducible protein A